MLIDVTQLQFQGENSRDEFERERIATKVISLLTAQIEISPMVIDGGWGTGKTEFCHKLINKFNTEHGQFKLIYVDAFQADHADDPLMTILAELLKRVETNKRSELINKALPVLRYGAKVALKAVANHALRQNADDIADGLEEQLKDTANQTVDASVEAVLKDHEEVEANLKALHTTLASIVANSPIVMFIDELDRCRPDFAVQMLEVIKHTFNVDGVQFVLITNTTQLKAAINHRYGQNVDAQRYLDKFLKFSFALPQFLPPQGHDKILASTKHFIELVKNSSILKLTILYDEQNNGFPFVRSLIEVGSLSLREIETFVRHLEIYSTLNGGSDCLGPGIVNGYRFLRLTAIYLYCFYPDVARATLRRHIDVDQFAECFGISNIRQLAVEPYSSELQIIIMMFIWDNNRASPIFEPPAGQDINAWVKSFVDPYLGGLQRAFWYEGSVVDAVVNTLASLSLNG